MSRGSLRRGVLILPSLFTLGNLFLGYCALMEATRGRFQGELPADAATYFGRAALFIALAMVLDGLDGKIARFAHATSPLGIQLDSLADVVSFGVAPGILAWTWALCSIPRVGWAVAFIFTACGALRLARFNVQAAVRPDHRYFVGLPIPGGACGIACIVYAWPDPIDDPRIAGLVAVWTVVLALLMVSTVRYPSLKAIDLKRRHPVRDLVWVVFLFALLRSFPEVTLAAAALLYVASGPVGKLLTGLGLLGGPGDGGSAGEPAGPADRHGAP